MASQADIDAITATLTSGVQEVRFADGRRVVYVSNDQKIAAINELRRQIISTDDRVSYAEFDRS